MRPLGWPRATRNASTGGVGAFLLVVVLLAVVFAPPAAAEQLDSDQPSVQPDYHPGDNHNCYEQHAYDWHNLAEYEFEVCESVTYDTDTDELTYNRATFSGAVIDEPWATGPVWVNYRVVTREGEAYNAEGEEGLGTFKRPIDSDSFGVRPNVTVDATDKSLYSMTETASSSNRDNAMKFSTWIVGPEGDEGVDVRRVAGTNRFSTAVAVSEDADQGVQGEDVLVANGLGYADALAAGPVAYSADDGGPGALLLTARGVLPSVTERRLDELNAGTIYVVGGPAAVSGDVEAKLARHAGHVVRLAGPTRFHTAAAVSEAFFDDSTYAVVATGSDYADALAGIPLAKLLDGPTLLTAQDQLPSATEEELRRLSPDWVFIMGGPAAVSDAVVDRIEEATGARVPRVAGANRFETAAKAASLLDSREVFAATGQDYPDALAGGALAGSRTSPVLLVGDHGASGSALAELRRRRANEIVILGGTAAVSERTEEELATYPTADGGCPPQPGSPC